VTEPGDDRPDVDAVAQSVADALDAVNAITLPDITVPAVPALDVTTPTATAPVAPDVAVEMLATITGTHRNFTLHVTRALDRAHATIARTVDRVLHPPRRVVIRWPERRHLTAKERERRSKANHAARVARRRTRRN